MTTEADSPPFQPPGWHTVTPRIVVHDAEMLVDFVKRFSRVFGGGGGAIRTHVLPRKRRQRTYGLAIVAGGKPKLMA